MKTSDHIFISKGIVYLDLFSGTGGFAKGLLDAGVRIKKHYFSEIDKFSVASYQYNFKDSENLGDIKKINGKKIEHPNVISFGSPCQDISIAGKRKGLKGKRSGLFFEAVRLIRECRPEVFIFENVKGIFSSNKGKDFEVILQAIADIGLYECQWQLLNTSWFLPQNRERLYLVGYLRGASRQQIFPIGESYKGDHSINKEKSQRENLSPTIDTKVGESTHRSPYVLHWKGSTTKWKSGRMKNSPTLNTQEDWIRNPLIVSGAAYRTRNYKGESGKIEIRKDKNANQLTSVQKDSMVLFHAPEVKRKGKTETNQYVISHYGFKDEPVRLSNITPTLKGHGHGHDLMVNSQFGLRRLTPIECERLQGFPDEWTRWGLFDGEVKEISDSQRYKMLGNAVSVVVVKAVGKKLLGETATIQIPNLKLLTLELELELLNFKKAA